MSTSLNMINIEYIGSSWRFVDHFGNQIRFDQAIVDAERIHGTRVNGKVRAVFGVNQEDYQRLPVATTRDLGIGVPNFGKGFNPSVRRVRLMPGGRIETMRDNGRFTTRAI